MIKNSITMFDKGYHTHFSDLEPNETPIVYCMAYAYPLSSASNAEYWLLITDKKFRLSRRKNSLFGLLEANDKLTIDINMVFAKDEKNIYGRRIQFYSADEKPKKARSPVAAGGIIASVYNSTIEPMILLHFKKDAYNDILNHFKNLGQLSE